MTMKQIKSIAATIVLALIFVPGFTMAQGGGQGNGGGNNDPEQMAKRQTEVMNTQLQLTQEQMPKIEQMNLETSKKMVDLRAQYQGNRDEMRPKMMEIMNARDAELKKILTPEQYDKWVKYRAERMANRSGGQGGGGGNRPQ